MSSLIGSWKLIGMEALDAEGNQTLPWGAYVEGLLIYTDDGWMSLQMRKPDANPDDPELFHSYYGMYSVDEKDVSVTHRVISSLNPTWNNSIQVRTYRIDGTLLILESPMISIEQAQTPVRVTTTWRRLTKS